MPGDPKTVPRLHPTPEEQLQVLEWAERSGIENLKTHLESANLHTAAAYTLINILLVGIGASLTIGIKVFDTSPPHIAWGALAACLHLMAVCIFVALTVVKAAPVPSVYNEPANLAQTNWTKADLLRKELALMQQRIGELCDLNEKRGSRLNNARLAAVVTPVSFLLFTAASAVWF